MITSSSFSHERIVLAFIQMCGMVNDCLWSLCSASCYFALLKQDFVRRLAVAWDGFRQVFQFPQPPITGYSRLRRNMAGKVTMIIEILNSSEFFFEILQRICIVCEICRDSAFPSTSLENDCINNSCNIMQMAAPCDGPN